MKVERVETIRIKIDGKFYCDVTPSVDYPEHHDVWLHIVGYGVSLHMFDLKFESEADLIEIVTANAPDYLEELEEMCNDR